MRMHVLLTSTVLRPPEKSDLLVRILILEVSRGIRSLVSSNVTAARSIMPQLSLVVAVPTFVCSLLSFLASSIFAVFYILYPPERHFRQALVVNLLIAGTRATKPSNTRRASCD